MTEWVFISDIRTARGISESRDSQERSFSGCDILMARIRHPVTRRLALACDVDQYCRWLDAFLFAGLDTDTEARIRAMAFTFGGRDE